MSERIELGKEGFGSPSMAIPPSEPDIHFPSFFFEGKPGQEIDLPDRGTMTIEYCVREEAERNTKAGKVCTYTIDVKAITSTKCCEMKKKSPMGGLDEAAKAVMEEMDEEEEESEEGEGSPKVR